MDPKTQYINSLFNTFQNNIASTVNAGSYTSNVNPLSTATTLTETNNNFVVSIDTSFNNRIFVDGDITLNSRLFLSNPNTLFVNGILYAGTQNFTNVFRDVSINGNIAVNGLTSLQDRLFVGNDVVLNSRLFLKWPLSSQ